MTDSNKTDAKAYGPYSPLRVVGDWAFVSGQVGVEAKNQTTSKLVEEQTKTALGNLEKVLASASFNKSDIVKTTIFLTDMSDFEALNKVYSNFFEDVQVRPARSTVAVKELPRVVEGVNLKVEIDAIAYKGAEDE
jgi:2-iminobutanoate/2-iminopropanoate deaminase